MYRRRTTASRRKAASAETVYLTIVIFQSLVGNGNGDAAETEITLFKRKIFGCKLLELDLNLILYISVSNVLQRHEELKERLSRDTDKMIYARLQKEFDAARAAQTEEVYLDGEEWNDGLLATIRQRVHMEADRKAMSGDAAALPEHHFHGKTTYRVGNKVICCLEGARIGIQYETSFAGESRELYHCVLESKSFLEKITVIEHTVPFFLSIQEAVNDLLSSNAMKFIDYVGELVQAYVDRREQVGLIKEMYGTRIGELYHSLSYNIIEFVIDDDDCKVTVSLRYLDLVSTLPTKIRVLAWPVHPSKKNLTATTMVNSSGNAIPAANATPARLTYAEDALRTMSLPEASFGAEFDVSAQGSMANQYTHVAGNRYAAHLIIGKRLSDVISIHTFVTELSESLDIR
ncbi:hypothetical protein Scep_023278 [Stephania cephalantha]|uniref:Centromere protein O n=1 Tax=Stephania cephalantha TaxID=152367 RepID=A0AAP0F1G3_9MAGN